MSISLALRGVGVALAGAGLVMSTGLPATASTSPSQLVFLVKDQGGGAFYNVTTGERYDVTAVSAVPTLGIFGVQAADGTVMDSTGQLFEPVGTATVGTPADSVVTVVQNSATGTFADAATGATYALATAGAAIPAGNQLALQTATNTILLLNGHVLIPVQSLTHT